MIGLPAPLGYIVGGGWGVESGLLVLTRFLSQESQMKFTRIIASIVGAVALSLGSYSSVASGQDCTGDINHDGLVNGLDLTIVLGQWGNCPGIVTSVVPLQGGYLGGTLITITGTSLAATTGVTIGGVAATNVVVLSGTSVRAVTPAGTVGPAVISIISPSSTTLAPLPFVYVQSSISSVVPSSGIYSGGTAITITGTFLSGATSVTVGGVAASNVVAVSSTTVTAVTPAGSVGAATVVVSGSKGTATAEGVFTYYTLWYTVLEQAPDPAIVTDPALRAAIVESGWAWKVRDNSSNIEMLLIPAGSFTMGCSPSVLHGCYSEENPTHAVTLTNAFYLARYEVTQAQWTATMGSNPSHFQGASYPDAASRPVEKVSWNMIVPFNTATGLRLPTEAEWEYAYRAQLGTSVTRTAFHNGTNDDALVGNIAWYNSNSGDQTHAVGGKTANALGLHDMSGNVWEWCNDWYGSTYYYSSPSTNPPGPSSGTTRVSRGGSWDADSTDCRGSRRDHSPPGSAYVFLGFRAARTP